MTCARHSSVLLMLVHGKSLANILTSFFQCYGFFSEDLSQCTVLTLAIQTESRPLDNTVGHKTSPQTKHGKNGSSTTLFITMFVLSYL